MILNKIRKAEPEGTSNANCNLGSISGINNSKYPYYWFILGIGSKLQVLASLSISEMLVLCCAPFLLKTELSYMRRHGVLTFFYMSLLLLVGCIVSLIANHSTSYQAVRGVSVTSIIVCSIIVGHHMLRSHPEGLKWYFIGSSLSTFLCTFIFKRPVETAMYGSDSQAIMSGTLFWIERLGVLFTLPARAFYLEMPLAYSAGVPVFLAFFSMLTSASGRSAALGAMGTAAIVLLGRKKQKSIKSIGRHFALLFCLAVLGIFLAKAAYQWAATNNYLGEAARLKYERQTSGGTGIVQLLIGGRLDSFVGLVAIADSPIWGKGYWAIDKERYYEKFLLKYGSQEDYENYIKIAMRNAERYIDYRSTKLIPCHSCITSFWLWFGLSGLLFWIYVVYVIFQYIRFDAYAVPQWFFWLAAGIPGFMWALCFSPFATRIGTPVWIVGMLMARAVRQRKYLLPDSMLIEIEKNERDR